MAAAVAVRAFSVVVVEVVVVLPPLFLIHRKGSLNQKKSDDRDGRGRYSDRKMSERAIETI